MTNGYMVYLLRILAAQGALASVYTDPDDPEGFSAGFVEAVDGQHVLMCDLSPWGQIDGWRVRRNQDVIQVLAGEEYEQRLAMLLAYHKQHHRCFFTEAPAEDTDLLLSVLIACKERGEIVSVIMGDDMITGRVLEANGLRLKLRLLDFFGREAEEETVTLREIEILEIATQEEQMYAVLEEMARQEMTLLAPDPTEDKMKITILTTFPEMFTPLHTSMLGRAEKAGILDIREVDIRAYSKNKHHNTDDAPFGGGAGMVMLAQPIVDAIRDVQGDRKVRRIYLSPRGETLTQKKAEQLAKEDELILLCGHYEGVDQRALDLCIDEELSIGDYILTGGELGAMVLVDCVARLVPGVLGCEESAQTESFSSGLLEYPQYTRPREFEGLTVPEPLLGGNHAHIVDWQISESLYITLRRRPEMARAYLKGRKFTRHQQKVVDAVFDRIREEDEKAHEGQAEEQL